MIARLTLGCLALAGASACAVTNTPYPPSALPSPVPAPSLSPYAAATRAPLHAELTACNGGGGANIGAVGERGEALLYTPYIFTPAGALLRNPTEAACLSSGFGWRERAEGGGRQHNGVDLANPNGGYIYAAGDGWVRFADWRGGFGLVLEIDHGSGVLTRYAHLSEIDPTLRPGVFVAGGAPVARMGATGNATGVHLHYELETDGFLVDPLTYGAKTISQDEIG